MYKNVYKYDEMKRQEHMAVRENVGWYLWTHQIVAVNGADACALLEKLCTRRIANLPVGKERYTTLLNEQGEIIDDVVVFRLEENYYWVSTLFATDLLRWIGQNKGTLQVSAENITSQYHMYAVQGPGSRKMVNLLTDEPVDDLAFFSFARNQIGDMPVMINRAGFTGEKLGYEIYVAAEKAEEMEAALHRVSEQTGAVEVTEFQIMAWTLPTEAGFYYMRDLRHTNPLEVGLEKGIGWDKDFIGKEALQKILDEGAAREMVGFTVEEPDAYIQSHHLGSPGQAVLVDGQEVGRVWKFVYSYVKETNIGYILAKKGALKEGDRVCIHGYEAVITGKSFL